MKLASATFLLISAVLWSGSAIAATVAIVRPPSGSAELKEASFRLQGELLAVGLEVRLVDRPARSAHDAASLRPELERLARERDLHAILEVIGEKRLQAVDVWMFQHAPRRVEVQRVQLEPSARRPSETLAIRAIEVLRSSFLELDLAGAVRPASASPLREQPELEPSAVRAPEPRTLWALEAGAAVVSGVNGVGPALLPLVRADWVAAPWLVAQATFAGLGTRPTLETPAGSAQVSQLFGLLGLCYCRVSTTEIRPALALSVGALRTALDGLAELPARGHHVVRWSLLTEASLGLRLPVSDQYYATLAAHVQLAQPYVAIHFADTPVATTGRPNLLFTLTIGAWL